MTFDEFRKACDASRAPDDLPPTLYALWQDCRGDWDGARKQYEEIATAYPDDGPTRFYLQLCVERQNAPPSSGPPGVVTLDQK